MADFENVFDGPISKINVVGTSGFGKSTFAKALAEILQVPYIEMDSLFWLPNWAQPSDEDFFKKLEVAVAEPAWVLDGNYTRSTPVKWRHVDLVIWIDTNFTKTLYQVIRRSITRAFDQKELWEGTGNRESLRQSFFSKKSIIWWMITTYRGVRKKYEAVMKDSKFSHIRFVSLRNRKEAQEFLERCRKYHYEEQAKKGSS